MKACLSCQNRCADCTFCFTKIHKELDDARELAAMYLQCLNSRALERGETVERIAKFCEQEFAENDWLKAEYEKLVDDQQATDRFIREAKLK